jgi:hypothetical protein
VKSAAVMSRTAARTLPVMLAALLILGRAEAAEPSFAAIDGEPLSAVKSGAVVLHAGWQIRESTIAGNDGSAFSRVGFKAGGWYATSVPTTVLGALVHRGVYPDPYVGLNNLRIPDASDEHNKRYDLSKYSHLPDKSNPWSRPW